MSNMKLVNIRKSYGSTEILKNINLEIESGQFVVLIGASGCGKSTLLRMISGLEDITEGELIIDGKVANRIPPQQRNISLVFQSYALYPHMSVFKNIAYGLNIRKVPKSVISKKVDEAARILNIAGLLDRYPKELSGGQRQRVAMGRAIVRDPAFFLFDEPLSNLDAKLRVTMRKEIKQLQSALKTTTVYVTHDQIEAMTMGDKVVLMNAGKIIQSGSPRELFDKPNCLYTATFLGSPGITIISGIVHFSDGKPYVKTKDGILFPAPQREGLEEGRPVKLGIRPRDFYPANSDWIKVETELVEYTGAEFVIYCLAGETELGVVFSRNIEFGDDLHIGYHPEKSHLFDEVTEKVI